MYRFALITSLSVSCLFTGCGMLPPIANPVASETRSVTVISDSTKTLTVKDGMVFYDATAASHGIRFPPGTYALEAEDASYWYLRAPAPLEMRTFESGHVAESHTASGGIMLGKSLAKTVILPAAGYVDAEGGNKLLLWKLGGEFMRLQGHQWSKSF